MDLDGILSALNSRHVDYLLIGGMNFFLRHQPVATFDVDLWIHANDDNLVRCEAALADMEAAWGQTERDWGDVKRLPQGWLSAQPLYCLTTRHGAVDIFLCVDGLPSWADCRQRAHAGRTGSGTAYWGLSDEDMLACQMAIPKPYRKQDRVAALRRALMRKT
jgi:hypothetical protein